ncbi:hypothetical protein N5F00_03965 [Pseudomonas chengduensis]|nr:hypothetical protein [Pseudomonas chengduensis]MDH1728641.1 hypothetical protein [Pseudomonas chengduensis]
MERTFAQACFGVLLSLVLTGCASQAPYGTPESTAKLVADLSLSKSPELVIPADWISAPYGVSKPQDTVSGLLVSTASGFRFVTYSEQRYRQAEELSKPALQCGYIWKGEYGSELLHLFTDDKLYLLLIREKGQQQINAAQRSRVIQHLRALGIPLLTEKDGAFFRETGNTTRGISKVQGSWVSAPDREREAFNPCKLQEG